MAENKFMFTREQAEAIKNRGGSLLVSAAAGSGKTKVLTERLLGYITGKENRNITDFLIITYTKAAAAELREKIRDSIMKKCAEEPENRHLRRQLLLIYRADIGTIHSFCSKVLRKGAHLIDIAPDFAVGDEAECRAIRLAVLRDMLEEKYETVGEDWEFEELAETLGAGRDDSRLENAILETYDKLQSHPDPKEWAEGKIAASDVSDVSDAMETVWGKVLAAELKTQLYAQQVRLDLLISDALAELEFWKKYGQSLSDTKNSVKALLEAFEDENITWDKLSDAAAKVVFPKPKSCKEFDDLKERRKSIKDGIERICEKLRFSSAELLLDTMAVSYIAKKLFALVIEFSDRYAKEKRRRNIADFSDLEHMAFELLVDKTSGGPTDIALEYRERFTEIMVDEYQDVNRVQDTIFQAVSKDGRNIFAVGDVKQSIYRFRLADPTIFMEKFNSFKLYSDAAGDEPRKVILSKNFRSRPGVLSACNFVFERVMSLEAGEVDYNEEQYLYPGAAYPKDDRSCIDFAIDIVDMKGSSELQPAPDKLQMEAEHTAQRILAIIALERVWTGSEYRKAEFGDIAVLMRSPGKVRRVFEEVFAKYGIPVDTGDTASFLETIEISVMTSLLSVIDNPHQDVPLVEVLTSPLYGFEPDELAEIKSSGRNCDFFDALKLAAATCERAAEFVDELESFRFMAADMTASDLIMKVYNATGALGIFGALPGGKSRKRNLMLLLENAKKFESGGYKGLFGFVNHIRGRIERGDEISIESSESSGGVKMMSMHKSKGLEFPFVILVNLERTLNMSDTVKPVLIHSKLGAGIKLTDKVRRIEYTTLPRMAIAQAIRNETVSEELRVLYVAMTRAKEKLYIISAFNDAAKELNKLIEFGCGLTWQYPGLILQTKRPIDWILLPILGLRDGIPFADGENISMYGETNIENMCYSFSLHNIPFDALTKTQTVKTDVSAAEASAKQEIGALFSYPFESAENIPSKLTATELKGRFFDEEAGEEAEKTQKSQKYLFKKPDFLPKTCLTGAEKGTALHLVMQFIDYDRCRAFEGVRTEIERLRAMRVINDMQAEAADPGKIFRFFSSELGKSLLASKNIYREFKFSVLVSAKEFYPESPDEEILMQGVIDCCFETERGLCILDFKTDMVTEDTAPERARLYTPQLKAYSDAMEKISGKAVAERILYFFNIEKAVSV